jgi:hypothetical protein
MTFTDAVFVALTLWGLLFLTIIVVARFPNERR